MNCIRKILSCPVALFGAVLAVSVLALAAAFIAEAFLGLEPCSLCIYQRIPFALGILLGGAGLVMRGNKALVPKLLALTGINFLTNAGIALYHSGVERHWWASAVEGCAVPDMGEDTQSILENIMSAPTGRCDEIPWADPVLGLSMANYNVALGLGLFALCLLGAFMQRPGPSR